MSETFIQTTVTYTIEKDGVPHVIRHVPARVSEQTGEQLFSPDTVDRLQRIISGSTKPSTFIQVPVFEFAA